MSLTLLLCRYRPLGPAWPCGWPMPLPVPVITGSAPAHFPVFACGTSVARISTSITGTSIVPFVAVATPSGPTVPVTVVHRLCIVVTVAVVVVGVRLVFSSIFVTATRAASCLWVALWAFPVVLDFGLFVFVVLLYLFLGYHHLHYFIDGGRLLRFLLRGQSCSKAFLGLIPA